MDGIFRRSNAFRRPTLQPQATNKSKGVFEEDQVPVHELASQSVGHTTSPTTYVHRPQYQQELDTARLRFPINEDDWMPTVTPEAYVTQHPTSRTEPYSAADNSHSTGKRVEMPTPLVAENESTSCANCEKYRSEIWFCNVCDLNFCNQCWSVQIVHKKPRGGIPHEKTNPNVAAIVRNALLSPVDHGARELLHKADASTAWFGVERPSEHSPVFFRDYGRFAELMRVTGAAGKNHKFLEQWTEIGRDKRTPSLISFVGQTGAGKSSLIKLLINFAVSSNGTSQTPVVGSRGAHLPTSEDVHLYLDPRTADSPMPLLYADCEGLEGGVSEPQAAAFKRKRRATTPDDVKITLERELLWANDNYSRTREFAVTHLYPRLLYTFSDVIVFVLRNPRVIETVFEKLIQWAAAAIETSSNQPVLPHAIIALNASENGTDSSPWNVVHATETILNDLASTVNENATFKRLAKFWRERGKAINNLENLIMCYYSTVQIIRVPTEGRPVLMEGQISKLYDSTLTACIAARCKRYQARMSLDVEELHNYLQKAFNHYSNTLDSPFDFVQASSRNSLIPADFGGNILKLALDMMHSLKPDENMDSRRIFDELSYMVASCIMLDSSRQKNKGSADQIFPKYINHLDDALESFYSQHWPCEFIHPKTKARCVNVRYGHSKGHQGKDGKVFATGEYLSSLSFEDQCGLFRDLVYSRLVDLLQVLADRSQDGYNPETQVAAHIHKTMVLGRIFSHAKHSDAGAKTHSYMISHTACFCCLFGQAEHFLPCGHVLCSPCIETYGRSQGLNAFEVNECPFEKVASDSDYSRMIYLTPKSAGPRVLALDGGGIRGIVELEVLRQIQIALGDVPIQCFIDLIVGTSTGGLVALGLGAMNWTVQECIGQFETLCHKAFTRRIGSSVPLFGTLVDNYHHSKYQTSTLEEAFMLAFTDNIYLFGGERPSQSNGSPVKVAVTAASLDGTNAYVISNYNRHQQSDKPIHYHFQRPESGSTELKVWEAARATAAAPRYFKSFHHEASQKTYIDGAVLHNNPIRIADSERRMLWPDHHVPDLILSIGTGSIPAVERHESEQKKAVRKGIISHSRHLLGLAMNSIEQTLDCEKTWNEYFAGIISSMAESSASSRFVRIDPNLGEIPGLDKTEEMGRLRRNAETALEYELEPQVSRIARQLIASSFYFELQSTSEVQRGGATDIYGKIHCRLLENSTEIRNFGKHLGKRAERNENLQFIVVQDGDTSPLATLPLTTKTANSMIQDGIFHTDLLEFSIPNRLLQTQIYLGFGRIHRHPISGFPRLIVQDDEHATSDNTLHHSISMPESDQYTHSFRRLKRFNNKWQPPDLRRVSSMSNLYEYANNPQRTLRHDFMQSEAIQSRSSQDHLQPSSRPHSQPPTQSSTPAVPTITAGIREAFRALIIRPMRSPKPRDDESTGPFLPPRPPPEYNPESDGRHTSEEMLAGLQNANVRPEDFAIYQQWVKLLQSGNESGSSYCLPDSDEVASSKSPATVHGLDYMGSPGSSR